VSGWFAEIRRNPFSLDSCFPFASPLLALPVIRFTLRFATELQLRFERWALAIQSIGGIATYIGRLRSH
jgi:hypothetical protein